MRKWVCMLFVAAAPALTYGADRPNWAFPEIDKVQPVSTPDDQPKTLAAGAKTYRQDQIDDLKNPPDWFTDMHPPMPPVMARGTATLACGSCHLSTGAAHDDSAYLAGLPFSYIVGQMTDFKSRARTGFGTMPDIVRALGGDDIRAAAQYFASLQRGRGSVLSRPTRSRRLSSIPAICDLRFPTAALSRLDDASVNCPKMRLPPLRGIRARVSSPMFRREVSPRVA
jgi:cytochrome c553